MLFVGHFETLIYSKFFFCYSKSLIQTILFVNSDISVRPRLTLRVNIRHVRKALKLELHSGGFESSSRLKNLEDPPS